MSYQPIDETAEGKAHTNLIHALVARGTVVLAEETLQLANGRRVAGNFHTVLSAKLLPKFPSGDGKYSFLFEKYMFHYMNENGVTYLCMADVDAKRRVAFGFLEDIKTQFLDDYRDKVATAITYGMNTDFAPKLQGTMQEWNNQQMNDRMAKARDKMASIRGVMVQSIEGLLERGEKLEILVDRTENLANSAQTFRHSGTQLRRKMWMRNLKWTVCMGLLGTSIAAAVIYSIYDVFE